MLLTNFIITAIAFWISATIYNKYIRKTIINKYRFNFFTMRDRLTLVVMKGNISTEDKEYVFLLNLINTSINVFDENFSFHGFIKYISLLVSNKRLDHKIESMIHSLNNHNNKDLALIARDYFDLNYQLYRKYTKRTPFSMFLGLLSSVSQIRQRKELQEKIDKRLESTLHDLQLACA